MSATGRMWRHNWRLDSRYRTRSSFTYSGQPRGLLRRHGRLKDFMGLVIAWRNLRPVQTVRRCTRMSENGSCALPVSSNANSSLKRAAFAFPSSASF